MYLLGDLNLNIFNDHRRTIADEYLSMLAGNGLFPLITKPTRINQESATLIDHIFTSEIANSSSSLLFFSFHKVTHEKNKSLHSERNKEHRITLRFSSRDAPCPKTQSINTY